MTFKYLSFSTFLNLKPLEYFIKTVFRKLMRKLTIFETAYREK